MAYIGPAPNFGQNREVDDISSSFNGSTTAFTLQVNSQNVSPGSSNAIIVSLGGVVQNPGTDYTVAASTLTFTTAPASGLSFFGLVLGQGIDTQTIADGQSPTMAAPSITGDLSIADKIVHTGDTNTAIRFSAADTVSVETGGSTRATVDSSGNVGIGPSSPTKSLDINTASATFRIRNSSGGNDFAFKTTAGPVSVVGCEANTELAFMTNDTENMRIRSSTGGLMIGDDGSTRIGEPKLHVLQGGANTNVASFFYNTSDDRTAVIIRHNGATTGTGRRLIDFLSDQGNSAGFIICDRTTTTYNTGSDYRLKENEVLISDGITRLKTLKPYRFNFKDNPSKIVDGFFAHEVTAVPEAISGIKDETENILYKDDDELPSGKNVGDVKETIPKYQGIDQSKLVPLLTAALQEAVTKIETLETKVAALEAA